MAGPGFHPPSPDLPRPPSCPQHRPGTPTNRLPVPLVQGPLPCFPAREGLRPRVPFTVRASARTPFRSRRARTLDTKHEANPDGDPYFSRFVSFVCNIRHSYNVSHTS